MEQRAEAMRAARGKAKGMADVRAMELQMKAPQLLDNNMLETTQEMRGSGAGGGDAGLARVVGGAKRRGRPPKNMVGGAVTLNDQIGEGSNGRMVGGARDMAKALAAQIKAIHGGAYMKEFADAMMEDDAPVAKGRKMKGGAGPISGHPSGIQVGHALMSPAQQGLAGQALGGQDVPPGGVAPMAYGNAPQAPASFARNSVGMGRPAGAGKALLGRPGHGTFQGGAVMKQSAKDREDEKLGMEVAMLKKKGGAMKGCAATACGGASKRSARGQAIAKLMKEKGMTLPQASKYLKENGGA
jgi:hypothetical protein